MYKWIGMSILVFYSFVTALPTYADNANKTTFPSHNINKTAKIKAEHQQKITSWKTQQIADKYKNIPKLPNLQEKKLVEHELSNLIVSSYKSSFDKTIAPESIEILTTVALDAMQNAMDHDSVYWSDHQTDFTIGRLKIEQTIIDAKNNFICRDFLHTLKIHDEEDTVTARACRELNNQGGAWHLIAYAG